MPGPKAYRPLGGGWAARRPPIYVPGSGVRGPPPPRVRSNFRFPPGCVPIWGFSTWGALGLPQLILSQHWPRRPKKDPKIVKKEPRLFQTAPQMVPICPQEDPKESQDRPRSSPQSPTKHTFSYGKTIVRSSRHHEARLTILEPGPKGLILSRQPRKMENV